MKAREAKCMKTGVKHGNRDDVVEMNELQVAEKGKESELKGNFKKQFSKFQRQRWCCFG